MLSYVLVGFGVGMLVGATGVGGGAIMTPVLILVFSVPAVTAVGTDLLYAASTKLFGVAVHGRAGHVEWAVVARLAAGSVPASLATLGWLARLDHPAGFEGVITMTLAVALILTACALALKPLLLRWAEQEHLEIIRALHRRLRTPMTVVAGALLGVCVTLSSVGAGALGGMLLFFLYPRLPAVSIVGTDLAHAVPLTAIAGAGHWLIGSVDLALLSALIIGAIPGILIGARFAQHVPDRVLRPVMAVVFLGVGIRLVI